MDQVCRPKAHSVLYVRSEVRHRAKVLAAQRRLTIGELIQRALDAFEVVEQTLAHAAKPGLSTDTEASGTDPADTIVYSSSEQEAA